MENENRESTELTLIKEVASLTTEVKYLREDMSDMKKDVRRLIEGIPKACLDCEVRQDLDTYIKEQKEREAEKKDSKKFNWDRFGILAAIILSFATLMFSIINENVRDRQKSATELNQSGKSSINSMAKP
jgi:hypothetical protein